MPKEKVDWEERLQQIKVAERELTVPHEPLPTDRQIAEYLGVSIHWIGKTRRQTGAGRRKLRDPR